MPKPGPKGLGRRWLGQRLYASAGSSRGGSRLAGQKTRQVSWLRQRWLFVSVVPKSGREQNQHKHSFQQPAAHSMKGTWPREDQVPATGVVSVHWGQGLPEWRNWPRPPPGGNWAGWIWSLFLFVSLSPLRTLFISPFSPSLYFLKLFWSVKESGLHLTNCATGLPVQPSPLGLLLHTGPLLSEPKRFAAPRVHNKYTGGNPEAGLLKGDTVTL